MQLSPSGIISRLTNSVRRKLPPRNRGSIYITLKGGLGNQMFQYAFARSLALNTKRRLFLDLAYLKRRDMPEGFVYRDYALHIFALDQHVDKVSTVPPSKSISERHFHYDAPLEHSLIQREDSVLHCSGYWQSYKYFADHSKILSQDFTFLASINSLKGPVTELLAEIHSSCSVALNVRRTDFVNNSFHGVLDKDYILAAQAFMERQVHNPHYFVFSDDLDWCYQHLRQPNVTVVDHTFAGPCFATYLQLMIHCKHFIIPNSTFGWWAAWLSSADEPIVIAPKQWFRNTLNTEDLTPPQWLRL